MTTNHNRTATTRRATATLKYRPSLTATQITYILALAKNDMVVGTDITAAVSVIGTLAPFQAKIDAGSIAASHTATPKQSVEESLGMHLQEHLQEGIAKADLSEYVSGTEVQPDLPEVTLSQTGDKAAYYQACYQKSQDYPEHCTLQELEAAREYRYLNDLMTPEEEREHEARTTA